MGRFLIGFVESIFKSLRCQHTKGNHRRKGQQQFSIWTQLDRYPSLFSAMSDLCCATRDMKILSFGCSTGEEIQSLDTRYFAGASIHGVDINASAVKAASMKDYSKNVVDVFSFDDFLKRLEQYNLIFAMSVLCRWPETKNSHDISEIYPFSDFAWTAALLDRRLAPGGYLVIFNANYRLEDTEFFSRKYEVVQIKFEEDQFVQQFAQNGKPLPHNSGNVVFRKLEPRP